ncbi:MAG: hypothetical protein KGJ12_00740 [Gammaproteobacteria bacterium]|nr:hypothetical protein [Gammaproteobacteria bacterium]
MNRKRTVVIGLAVTAWVLMALFPPWRDTWVNAEGYRMVYDAGYHFLFSPPAPMFPNKPHVYLARLLIQGAAVLVIAVPLVLIFGKRKRGS